MIQALNKRKWSRLRLETQKKLLNVETNLNPNSYSDVFYIVGRAYVDQVY